MLMVRSLHDFETGRLYHITTRALHGRFLFEPDREKRVIIEALDHYRRAGVLTVYGFVVMANHVHLVLQPTIEDFSKIIAGFKRWTSRHSRTKPDGTAAWEEGFDDNLIRSMYEMRSVVRYVHSNPVRIGLTESPEDYFWSSARNYAALSPVAMTVETEWW